MNNPNQIRFITQNYEHLQGIRQVPTGFIILLIGILSLGIDTSHLPDWLLIMALLIAVGFATSVGERFRRYYVEQYGSVTSGFSMQQLLWAGLIAVVAVIEVRVDPPISITLVVMGVYFLVRWQMADGLGKHYFLLALVLGAASLFPLLVTTDGRVAILLIAYGIIFVVEGLLDHQMLVNALKKPDEDDTDDDTI